ncbi:unnamed protein product [Closterium sp. NIES-53]
MVKRPPGSPLAFKARYVARGFSERQGVDYFQTFSPTPKMTTLRVLLYVAAQHDYELHSLDFSTAFLQGSLHEEIWLHRPPGFTGSFPAGTQWSLRRPVYGLRQAPREWHDTLRTTLAALGFAPTTADTSLFLRTDTSLPPFHVLVYVDDLIFATADTEALTLVKSELQKRHTCTDLGELRSYLGSQITRDRARRTITLTQSHMVHQVLQRFSFLFSSPQPTPLSTSHSLLAPPSDESNVPIFDLDFDAILAAMYAHADIIEGDGYLRVPPDPGTVAAALGASASAAPGAGTSPPSGTPPTASFHTFTIDSGALRSFFRDSTTLTPLSRPVAVSLADPSGGPVIAHSSTVLPCPAAPSGLLSGLHLPSFSTNLVSGADLQDAWVDQFTPGGQRVTHCTCSRTGRHLATFTRRPRSSLYTLTTAPPPVAASGQVFAAASRSSPASAPARVVLWRTRLSSGTTALVTPPCLVFEGRQRAAPHSSSFPPTEAPLQTPHMDVWGPARVRGQGHERYFLLVVDDYSRYTTLFPLRSKGELTEVLIDWIRDARRQLSDSFGSDLLVLRLHSDRGGEFSSDLLRAFCHLEGIRQTFTLPASPQQNGIAERRIGMVMDVARTSMIHAAAPHFLWPFAVQYAAHQINLQPRVSLPETTPTMRWMKKVGDASAFRVWGSRAFVHDPTADKLSSRAVPCVFLGFPPDAPGWQFYHPTSRRVLSSQDVTFDESVSYYHPAEPVEVAVDSGAARGADLGVLRLGALGVPSRREPLSPQRLREWYSRRCRVAAGVVAAGAGAAGVTGGVVATGGTAGAGAAGGAAGATRGAGAAGGAAGATGGAGAGAAGGATGTGDPGAEGTGSVSAPASPLPGPSPYSGPTRGLTERREPESRPVSPESRPASPVRTVRAGRVSRSCLPPVPGIHSMTLRPSTAPQRVSLPSPPASSLPDGPDPESDSLRATSPTVTHFLATAVTDPLFASSAASALVAELVDFAAACRLDYAASLVAESASASVCPPSVGGECALGTDVLEDRQEDLECFAAASPHLVSMLLAPEGDPDALDIPTPHSYAEAIEGPYSSQWQAAMDAEMASWKSTGTYVDEVPPPRANIVSGMWIFRVKRPPGSPPAFKARYVARGFSQRQGVDFFQTFSPTLKMTTLRVLLHVAAQRDYELHSLDFSTAFLQGSLHEEIWLRRPPGFTESFPTGTQWSLRRPVYSLRQAPREWHDTLRTTLASLGFAPSTADPSLFLRTDATLPPFYVLVYVLQRFDFTYSSPQSTPLPTGHSLSAPPSDESVEPSGPYPELVGCLITSGMGLVLGGRARVVLTGHADASWDDDLATQRSSSCEAEIYAGAMAAQELRWLTYLLTDLGEVPRSPPVLYVDNKAMLALCQEHRLEHRTSHIALRYFLSRELQQCRQLRLAYVASQANTADVFTKALQPCDHQPCFAFLDWSGDLFTSGMGLVLGGRGPVVLTSHADASWVDDSATQWSSQGYTFSLGSVSVSWRSTRSSSVLSSCTEAEIYAGAMAAQVLCWLTYLLTDLGEQPRSPPVLYVDNKAMIALCQEHRLEHRTKHIALRYFLAQELQQIY